MKPKLLVICGPTATGKTKLALHLSKLFNGEVVSADSRQVYKCMDIGTGKDLPVNVKCQISNIKFKNTKIPFYEVEGVKIWGYDLVDPKEEFSVAQYITIANLILKDIWQRGKLPILVGGTGLYIKGVVDGIVTSSIPKNEDLRKSLEGKAVEELFEILRVRDPIKAASMNSSDRSNPRRLIRAIEIANFSASSQRVKENNTSMNRFIEVTKDSENNENAVLFIGLNAPKEVLNLRIKERIRDRLDKGIIAEIKKLLNSGVSWNMQSMNTLGYRQWANYFMQFGNRYGREEGITEDTENTEGTERKKIIQSWVHDERNYAKRQVTWFKKDTRINWFDISRSNWQKNVEKLVKKWHNN